jgi:hypothetical protein
LGVLISASLDAPPDRQHTTQPQHLAGQQDMARCIAHGVPGLRTEDGGAGADQREWVTITGYATATVPYAIRNSCQLR